MNTSTSQLALISLFAFYANMTAYPQAASLPASAPVPAPQAPPGEPSASLVLPETTDPLVQGGSLNAVPCEPFGLFTLENVWCGLPNLGGVFTQLAGILPGALIRALPAGPFKIPTCQIIRKEEPGLLGLDLPGFGEWDRVIRHLEVNFRVFIGHGTAVAHQ